MPDIDIVQADIRKHMDGIKLSWHDHAIDISGLVDRPCKITMVELVSPTKVFSACYSELCWQPQKGTEPHSKMNWLPLGMSSGIYSGVDRCAVA